jgi:zinc/manganese transport system permease protein
VSGFGAILVDPFAAYGFMRLALVACAALALANGPVGVLLLARRMSLAGDLLGHAVMPGAALGFLLAGYALWALSLGGFVTGLLVGLLATLVGRMSAAQQEAGLAAFYLLSLSLGVLLVALQGSNIDIMHVLFGTVLAVDPPTLVLIAALASVVVLALAALYRPFALDAVDPPFLAALGGGARLYRAVFLVLVVLCLVAGFEAFGTLLAAGPLLLPAAAARCWTRRLGPAIAISTALGLVSGYLGLLVSFFVNLPSGPAIVLAAGAFYIASLAATRRRAPSGARAALGASWSG